MSTSSTAVRCATGFGFYQEVSNVFTLLCRISFHAVWDVACVLWAVCWLLYHTCTRLHSDPCVDPLPPPPPLTASQVVADILLVPLLISVVYLGMLLQGVGGALCCWPLLSLRLLLLLPVILCSVDNTEDVARTAHLRTPLSPFPTPQFQLSFPRLHRLITLYPLPCRTWQPYTTVSTIVSSPAPPL